MWPRAVLRGDTSRIVVGARTSIQDGAVIHCTMERETHIGDDCVIGHLVHMEGCTIESGALVGSGSIVLHRAVVRTGALVGAAALVTNDTDVPSGAMALGVPAKLRLDCVDANDILEQAARYVANGKYHGAETRRVD